MGGRAMGGHQQRSEGASDEWLTPPALVRALGPFDLDPCAPVDRPWPTADRHLTVVDDGLRTPWPERAYVWCNPPYGAETWRWLHKLADHPAGGIGLIFARTETSGFFHTVWSRADALLFLAGRIRFHDVSGRPDDYTGGAPSVLVAYGDRAHRALIAAVDGGLAGALVRGVIARSAQPGLFGTEPAPA